MPCRACQNLACLCKAAAVLFFSRGAPSHALPVQMADANTTDLLSGQMRECLPD